MNAPKELKQRQLDRETDSALHQIRLRAAGLSYELYFLHQMIQEGFAKENSPREGLRLDIIAVRGLCEQLSRLETEALSLSDCAREVLGLPAETVAEEYQ